MTALLAAARAVQFASLMAIFGGSTYALLLRHAGLWGAPPKGIRLLFLAAATLGIVSGIVWFCLIAGQMSGSLQGSLDPAVIELAATATRFGHDFLGRFIGLVVLWFMCALKTRVDSPATSLLAGLLLASLGPVSHAAADGDILSVGAVSDAVHLLTAGFWLGGLVVLAMFLHRNREDRPSIGGALRLFSAWGAVAVSLLVVSGLVNTISILPISEMSLHNAYFALLLVKVGLASVMIGLAALNRWGLAPALRSGGEGVADRLATSIGGEILLGFAVVAIAGLLGLMPPH